MRTVVLAALAHVCTAAALQSATPPTYVERDGRIVIEAENPTRVKGFEVVEHQEASGGKAVQVGEKSGEIHYRVEFPKDGRWYVWLRTRAKDAESNGLHLKLDGRVVVAPRDHDLAGQTGIYLKKRGWSWEPEWYGKGKGKHKGPITIDVKKGTRAFTITKRKRERPLIDKIVITRDKTPPAGLGPEATLKTDSR